MAMEGKYVIAKLNNSNYFNWRYKIQMLLIDKGVWNAVNDSEPDPVTVAWTENDRKAHSTIALCVEDDQIQHIRNCQTARSAWNKLKDFHEKDTPNNRVSILRQLMTQRLEEGGDVELHLAKMNELFQKLLALGDLNPEFILSATILGSLPAGYDGLVTALEARSEELTGSLVCSRIMAESKRRQERKQDGGGSSSGSDSMAFRVDASMNVLKCYFCDEQGHIKRNCKKYKAWLEKRESRNEAANFVRSREERDPDGSFL